MLDIAPMAIADEEASPQDLRRAQILQASRECFSRQGFHGASMQQICGAAKMSPGALYRYFPSKEAIIEAIADEERTRATEVMAVLAGPGSLIDRLVACAVAYLEFMRPPGSSALMLEICSESLRNTAVGTRFSCNESIVRDQLAALIATARDAGDITADMDVDLIINMLLSVGDGLVLRMALDRDFEPTDCIPALRRMLVGLLDPTAAERAARTT